MILGPFKFDESRPYVSASPKECSTLPSTSDSDGKTVGATCAVKSSVWGLRRLQPFTRRRCACATVLIGFCGSHAPPSNLKELEAASVLRRFAGQECAGAVGEFFSRK